MKYLTNEFICSLTIDYARYLIVANWYAVKVSDTTMTP